MFVFHLFLSAGADFLLCSVVQRSRCVIDLAVNFLGFREGQCVIGAGFCFVFHSNCRQDQNDMV